MLKLTLATSTIQNRIRTDFSFNGSPDSNYEIATNVPLNEYVPIGVVSQSLTRVGWVYMFTSNTNADASHWRVKLYANSSPSGTFAGRIVAIKI